MTLANLNTKIILVGNAQSGKTRIARLMSEILHCGHKDSSEEMLSIIETSLALDHGLEYNSIEDMKADKFNQREKWAAGIVNYCAENGPTIIADRIYHRNRIYVGPRKVYEYTAIREKYKPISIWIESNMPTTSDMELRDWHCDVSLCNDGHWSETVNRCLTIIRRFNLDGSHEIPR